MIPATPAVEGAAAVEPGNQPTARARRRKVRHGSLLPWISLVVVVALWQVGASFHFLDRETFSAPSSVVSAGWAALQTSAFWNDVWLSVQEFGIGYLLAVVLAVPFGIVTGWFRRCQYFFDPWLNAANATPRIALLPLLVIWFGVFGMQSKVAVVFIGVFVSVAVNTFNGVRTVDRALVDVAGSFGAGTVKKQLTVVFPSVLPFALVGMRLGIGRGVAGVMVGEYFTSTAGLGNFVFRAGQTLQTDKLIFGAVFITLLALAAFHGLARIEKRFTAWRPRVGSARE